MSAPTLEDTLTLALEAHRGQTDRAGDPYILHPLRLMSRFRDYEARVVAVLHDVVEDTAVTLAGLRARGYSEPILAALECLTRRSDETYEAFVERVAVNPLAVRVKLADLEDNMDVRRLPTVSDKDRERLDRYTKAWRRLQ